MKEPVMEISDMPTRVFVAAILANLAIDHNETYRFRKEKRRKLGNPTLKDGFPPHYIILRQSEMIAYAKLEATREAAHELGVYDLFDVAYKRGQILIDPVQERDEPQEGDPGAP